MGTSRRIFLRGIAPLAVLAGAGLPLLAHAGQAGRQMPQPPPMPLDPQGLPDDDLPKLDPKAVMKADQARMKKEVEALFALAQDLKDQVEKTDSSAVLSLNMIRKAQEIEKLAHHIQKLAAEG